MAPSTLAAAKTDLYNRFASDAAGTPVAGINSYVGKVFKGEPRPGDHIQPNGLAMVSIWTAGVDATSFTFTVRVYKHTDADVISAQDMLDNAVWAVEGALSSEFERSVWTFAFDPNISLLMAETTITAPRTDF